MSQFCRMIWLLLSLGMLMASKAGACESVTVEWDTMSEIQLTLRSKNGVTRQLDTKIAETPRQHAAGFQHICTELVQQWAILFVFRSPQQTRFHMRNVKESLDIAFISEGGRILEIQEMAVEDEPGSSRLYRASQEYQYALEAAAGRLSALGLRPEEWWLISKSWKM